MVEADGSEQIKQDSIVSASAIDMSLTPESKSDSVGMLSVDPRDLANVGDRPSPLLLVGQQSNTTQINDLREIRKALTAHPLVPRGIEIKINAMMYRGYKIVGGKPEYHADIIKLLNNSGGLRMIRQFAKNAYAFGNGYLLLVPNKEGTEIMYLKEKHPVYFGMYKIKKNLGEKNKYYPEESLVPYKDEWIIAFKENTQEIVGYSEYWYDVNERKPYIPKGEKVPNIFPKERVAQLVFDRWGDELEGISVIQYIYSTIKYLLNMEEAGAEKMWRDGFTQKKVKHNLTNPKDIHTLRTNVAQLNAKDVILINQDTEVDLLIPGPSQFPDFWPLYVKLIASRLGIPLPFLTQSGTDTNKSTIDIQMEKIREDSYIDELEIQEVFKEEVFLPALRMKYGDSVLEEDVPMLIFNRRKEDEDLLIDREEKRGHAIKDITDSIKNLIELATPETTAAALKLIKKLENVIETLPDEEQDLTSNIGGPANGGL
ncbi:MAG: hypothetical protein HY361_01585 [Candidatus Aenigmarchaeota archaeon]|nr:hypothetical protein [Candidatus Aenigmarchaeota archaeon]